MTEPTPAAPSADRWVWIDLEMTGLDPATCVILEIASIVTDRELNVIAEGPDLVVHQSDEVLDSMSEWCVEHHGKSGLTAACKASAISLEQAEEQTLAVLRAHVEPGAAPICGNSVGLDWRFIRAHMPRLAAFLADRIIDVTTVKELARRWHPDAPPLVKAGGHRALADIEESIAELAHYRAHVFRAPDSSAPDSSGADSSAPDSKEL